MKNLQIKIEAGTLLIIDSDNGEIMYEIGKHELPQIRTIEGNLSEWIMQLMEKTWINTEILYQLAVVIKREFPDNSIDWRKTFFIVEKANYLESLGDILTNKKKSMTARFLEKINFGIKETNEETHKIVDEIVTKRLNEFGL